VIIKHVTEGCTALESWTLDKWLQVRVGSSLSKCGNSDVEPIDYSECTEFKKP
jgi:hypothetical protein